MVTAKLFIATYTHRNSIYEYLQFLFNFIEKIPVPKAKRLLLILPDFVREIR